MNLIFLYFLLSRRCSVGLWRCCFTLSCSKEPNEAKTPKEPNEATLGIEKMNRLARASWRATIALSSKKRGYPREVGCPDARSWEMRKFKRAVPLRFGHPLHRLRKSMDLHVKSGSPMRLSWGMGKGEIYPVGTGRPLHSSRKSMELHVRSG